MSLASRSFLRACPFGGAFLQHPIRLNIRPFRAAQRSSFQIPASSRSAPNPPNPGHYRAAFAWRTNGFAAPNIANENGAGLHSVKCRLKRGRYRKALTMFIPKIAECAQSRLKTRSFQMDPKRRCAFGYQDSRVMIRPYFAALAIERNHSYLALRASFAGQNRSRMGSPTVKSAGQ